VLYPYAQKRCKAIEPMIAVATSIATVNAGRHTAYSVILMRHTISTRYSLQSKTERRFSACTSAICAYESAVCGFFESLGCLKNVSGGQRDANFGFLGARRIIFLKRRAKQSTCAVLIHASLDQNKHKFNLWRQIN
jgi:hypothetical protein